MSHLEKSLDLYRNVMIRACAGAGKTYALTMRYINILNDYAGKFKVKPIDAWRGPANILVITFTRKATAEMSNRIYNSVSRMLRGEKSELSTAIPEFGRNIETLAQTDNRYIAWLQREFSRSQIMTIDAFCHNILLDNPLQAGIDPGISTVEEAEVRELVNSARSDFISELAKEYDPDLKNLIDGIGLYNVKQYLSYLDDRPVEFERVKELFNNSDEFILKEWRDLYEPKDLPIDDTVNQFKTFIDEISTMGLDEKISVAWNEYAKIVNDFYSFPEAERYSFYVEKIHPFFITTNGAYLKKLWTGVQKDWIDVGHTAQDKRDFDARSTGFLASLNDNLPIASINQIFTTYDSRARPLIRSLIRVYYRYSEYLEQRKRREGVLTFTDVIVKTRQLLKDPAIAEKYRTRYDHILIDEFQDTNDLRWDIIKSITSRNGELRNKGIFLVGDEKQSIYRFQKADVTVMNRARIDLRKSGNFDLVEFDDNYRSSEWLINECLNPLFEQILYNKDDNQSESGKKHEFEARYQKTHYPENKSAEALELDRKIEGFFNVDILAVPADKKETFRKDVLFYARHVAKSVKTILADIKAKPGWEDLKGPPKIGILLRQVKTNSILFREAFAKEGVELEIVGGRGFWGRQEVMDIEAVLAFLINPLDDVALITLLRSPIFAFDDITLNNLFKKDRREKSIYQIFTSEYGNVKAELEDWIYKSKYHPIDRLLYEIFDNNHRDLGYFSETDGKQRWANLQKCINIIHTWSLKGMNISDIRNRMRVRIDEEVEGDFALLPTTSDVVLMSIHQAKGLEFPVVIVPDLQRNFQYSRSSSILLERLYGNNGKSRSELGITVNTITGESGSTKLLKALKMQVKDEEFAENKRLLYVAVTRAKYGVLLSGYLEEQRNGFPDPLEFNKARNFLDWIRNVYELTGNVITTGIPPDSENIPNISIHRFKEITRESDSIQKTSLKLSDEQVKHPSFKRISVHDLMDRTEITNEDDRIETELSGKAFGNLIHKIFEKNWLDYSIHWDKIITWADREEDGFDVESNKDELKEYLDRLQNLPVTRKILNIPDTVKFLEHRVNGLICSEDESKIYELTGVVDLLYQDNDEWVVLDYKTDNDYRQQPEYEKQIQIYLHLVKYLYGFEKVRGELFFTRTGIIIPVDFIDNYLSQLNFEGIRSWQFLPSEKIPGELSSGFPEIENDAVIICPTRRWADELSMILVRHKKLLLSHRIFSPGAIEELLDWGSLRIPSQSVKRMVLRKIFKSDYSGVNFDEYPGLLSAFVSAFNLIDQHNLKPLKKIEKYYQRYKDELIKNNYCTDIIPLVKDQIDWSDKQVIIDGCIAVTGKEISLYKTLSKKAKVINYLPLNKEPQQEFDYDLNKLSFEEIKLPATSDYHYYRPFDIEDELELHANIILREKEKGMAYTDMLIVLPSMEQYVPRLLNVFRRYRIPLTITKREPLLERPATKAVLSLLRLINIADPDWQTIRTWFSHPLSLTEIPEAQRIDFEEHLKKLDLVLRRSGIKRLSVADDDFFNALEAERKFPKHYIGYAKNVRDELAKSLKSTKCENESITGIHFENIIESIVKAYSPADEMEKRSLDELLRVVKHLNKSIADTGLTLPRTIFQREFEAALAGIEIPTYEQDWGIQVVSVPDSTNIRRKVLFAMGLSQSDFPALTKGNFLIDEYEDFHDVTNRLIFQSWFENFETLYMTCPEKDSEGKDQQYSVLLEPLKVQKYSPAILKDTNYSRKKNTIGKEIHCETESLILKRQVDRHNVLLLNNPLDTKYFGNLETSQKYLVQRPLSATMLDEIANKPLYFLMYRGWNIPETDREISVPMQKGLLIHEVLEKFGKLTPDDGWSINRSNPDIAGKKMLEVFRTTLNEKQLKINSDLEVYAAYQPFILGTDRGLLLKILEEDLVRIKDFKFISAEQRFGFNDEWDYYEITHHTLGPIKFRGKIDRFDLNEENKIIVVVDFKTGNVDWNAVGKYRSFQLPLYYQVLKREYPDYKILITFRQLKSLRNKEYGFYKYWLGDLNDNGVPEIGIKRNKRHLGEIGVIGFEKKILDCLSSIYTGIFRLFAIGSKVSEVSYYHLTAASRLDTVKFIVEPDTDRSVFGD